MHEDAGGVEHRAQARGGAGQRGEDGGHGVGRRDVPGPYALLHAAYGVLDQVAAQALDGGRELPIGEQRVGARDLSARVGTHRLRSVGAGPDDGPARTVAEADGNRTRLTEVLGHVGFRGRGGHQAP